MEPVEDIRRSVDRICREKGRPLVTLTYAQSLDGSIALRRDERFIISGPESKRLTHHLRAAHDAILVGIGTVLADDPKLTARLAGGPHPQPIVLDTQLRIPATARLLRHPRGLLIATGPHPSATRVRELEAQGAEVMPLPLAGDKVDLKALLTHLRRRGIHSIMVEGGARVLASFLRSQLVDWVLVTVAPCLVGGVHAIDTPTVTAPTSPSDVLAFPCLKGWRHQSFGRDLVIWGEVTWPQ